MRLFYGVILGLILITTFFVFYKKEKDILCPICFFSFFQFLIYVPNMIYKNFESYTLLTYENTFTVLIYEIIFILFIIFGYTINSKKYIKDNTIAIISISDRKQNLLIFIFFMVGFSAKIFVIHRLGGIQYVFNNMSIAYSAQSSGYGYVNYLAKFMLVAILLMFDRITKNNKLRYKFILFIMVLLYMLSYFIYSSRGPALELILILVFCINYLIKKIKIRDLLMPKYLIILVFVALISVVLVSFRGNNSGQTLNMDIVSKLKNVGFAFLDEFSKVGRDAFTYETFNSGNFWGGKIYSNILTGFIPSKIYINKPPIDDGLYLLHLMLGISIDPTQGRLDLTYMAGSVPFSSQGLLFANFGLFGLILGGLITGVLYRKVYDATKKRCNAFGVASYFYFIYMFGFTPLYIINTIQYILMFWIFGNLLYYRKKRITKKTENIIRSGDLCEF